MVLPKAPHSARPGQGGGGNQNSKPGLAAVAYNFRDDRASEASGTESENESEQEQDHERSEPDSVFGEGQGEIDDSQARDRGGAEPAVLDEFDLPPAFSPPPQEDEPDFDADFLQDMEAEYSQPVRASPQVRQEPAQAQRALPLQVRSPVRPSPPTPPRQAAVRVFRPPAPRPPVAAPRVMSIDDTIRALKASLEAELESKNDTVVPLFTEVVRSAMVEHGAIVSNHGVLPRNPVVYAAVDVLYRYVDGDNTYQPGDQRYDALQWRLCRGFNSNCFMETQHALSELVYCLRDFVDRCGGPDKDLYQHKLSVAQARTTAATRYATARRLYNSSVCTAWDPMFDAGICADTVESSDNKDKFKLAKDVCLSYCALRQLRTHNKVIYEPVKHNGMYCRAYRPIDEDERTQRRLTMRKLVAAKVPNDPTLEDRDRAEIQSHQRVADYLCDHDSPKCPELHRNYHLFAFRNCVYDIATDRVYRHDEPFENCGKNNVACKFFDMTMDIPEDRSTGFFPGNKFTQSDAEFEDDPNDFMNCVPTPMLDKILDFQWPQTPEEQAGLPPTEQTPDPRLLKRMFVAMLGRTMFEQNEFDDSDIMILIVGASGNGKSAVSDTLAENIYNPEDVATLARKTQATFGLQSLVGRRLVKITEAGLIGQKDGLSEDDVLKIASGERVEVRIKFGESEFMVLRLPVFMVGNAAPSWRNDEQCMSRRLFYVKWPRKPVTRDERVRKALFAEAPYIMIKAARAFKWLRNYRETHNIHSLHWIMPKHVRNNLRSLGGSTNVQEYLESGEYFYDGNTKLAKDQDEFQRMRASNKCLMYITYQTLHDKYVEWAKKHGKKAYGKAYGDSNRASNLLDWKLALETSFPNAGFILSEGVPVKVRCDYPRNTRGDVDQEVVQNLEQRYSVTPLEAEELEQRTRDRERELHNQQQAGQAEVVEVKAKLKEANDIRFMFMGMDSRPDEENEHRITLVLEHFEQWFNSMTRRDPAQGDNPIHGEAKSQYRNICQWLGRPTRLVG